MKYYVNYQKKSAAGKIGVIAGEPIEFETAEEAGEYAEAVVEKLQLAYPEAEIGYELGVLDRVVR